MTSQKFDMAELNLATNSTVYVPQSFSEVFAAEQNKHLREIFSFKIVV